MAARRRLNWKFLALTLVPLVLLLPGIHFLHGSQLDRTIGLLRERSKESLKAKNNDEAARELQQYLGFRPNDVEALLELGELEGARARDPRALNRVWQIYEQVVRLDPNRKEARRKAAEIAMRPELQLYRDAANHITKLLPKVEEQKAGDAELVDLLGQCHEGLLEYPEAVTEYRRALKLDPSRVPTYVRLAKVLRNRLNDETAANLEMDAVEQVKGVVAKNPDRADAYLARARYRQQYQIDGAEADIARALELGPDNPDVLLAASQVAILKGEAERAREFAQRGLKLRPTEGSFYNILAEVDRLGTKPDAQFETLKQGIKEVGESPAAVMLRWTLAGSYIESGKIKAAQDEIKLLRNERIRPELLDLLEARILVAERKWPAAAKALEDVHRFLRNDPQLSYETNLMLAQCYERLGDTERRVETYNRAIELNREALPAQLGLAAALVDQGKAAEAEKIYESLAERVPGVWLLIARLRLERALSTNEGQPINWAPVFAALDSAEKAQPGAPEVALLRAGIQQREGKTEEARATLARAVERNPDDAALRVALSNLSTPGGVSPSELEKTLGDGLAGRQALVGYWLSRGGDAAGPELAKIESAVDTLPAGDRLVLLRDLAFAAQRRRDDAASRRLFRRLMTLEPSFGYALALYEVALRTNPRDPAELAEARKQLLERLAATPDVSVRSLEVLYELAAIDSDESVVEPAIAALKKAEGEQGPYWRYATARGLLREALAPPPGTTPDPARPLVLSDEAKSTLGKALELLDQASSRRPSWPAPVIARAEINRLLGDRPGAIREFERAKQMNATAPFVFLSLYRLYMEAGQPEQADAQVRALQNLPSTTDGTDDVLLRRLAAEASLRARDPAKAIEEARAAVKPDSKDPRDQLWLAQVYLAAGKPDECEAALKKAIELGPADPVAWQTLISFVISRGRRAEAPALIERAKAALKPADQPLTLAACYEALGDIPQARVLYASALAAKPEDPQVLGRVAAFELNTRRPEQSEALLRKILATAEKSGPASGPEVAGAKRVLAVVLASTRVPAKYDEALSLLGLPKDLKSYTPAPSVPTETIRAQIQVLALQPSHLSRQTAINLLRVLIDRRNEATPSEELLLAQLLADEGDWSRASDTLIRLLAKNPEDVAALTQYVRWLLDSDPRRGRHDVAAAGPYLDRLEKASPGLASTIELRALQLKQMKRSAEALPLVDRFAQQSPDNLGRAAAIYEMLGAADRAEQGFRSAAETSGRPLDWLLLAQYLERAKKYDEADATYKKFMEVVKQPQAGLDYAEFLGRRDKLSEAIDRCEQVQATPGVSPGGPARAALMVANRADLDPAQAQRVEGILKKALTAQPDDADIRLLWATFLSLVKRYDESEAALKALLESRKDGAAAMNNLAWLIALHQPARAAEALSWVDQAIQLSGELPDMLDTKALVLLAMDKPKEAASLLDEALRMSPAPTPLMLVHQARAYVELGKLDEARKLYDEAKEAGLDESRVPLLEKPAYDAMKQALTGR